VAAARTVAGKLVRLLLVLYVVTFGTFLLMRVLPGDPVVKILPYGTDIEAQRAELRAEIGLDRPPLQQYATWLGGLAGGDFGRTYPSRTQVTETLRSAVPVTIQLIVYTQVLALLVAVPAAVLSAHRSGSWIDRTISTTAFGLLSVPSFVLGLYLAYFVGAKLHWLPAGRYVRFDAGTIDHLRSMALPTIALAAGQVAIYLRLLRSDMIATLQEDFIKTARSKGVSTQRILWRHALRPSSLTLLTFAGLNFGTLVGGAVVIEIVFSLPGLGTEILKAIQGQQYIALQSYVVLVAVGFVVVNFVVDFLYTVLDPRIRHGGRR
jgi:peptide/nickel transport system permease protein